MQQEDDHILDRFEDRPPQRWYESRLLYYLSFLLIICGAVLKIMHWPMANLLMLVGFGTMMVRSLLIFLSLSRVTYEWLFFTGQIAVVSFLVLRFVYNLIHPGIAYVLIIFFVLGFLSYLFQWPGNKVDQLPGSESEDSEEDEDY